MTAVAGDALTSEFAAFVRHATGRDYSPADLRKALDRQGGEKPKVPLEALAEADFITYADDVPGATCKNCLYNRDGVCVHPAIRSQPVTKRNCCKYWDAPGTLRAFPPWMQAEDPDALIDLPNVRQEDVYSCGAAVAMSVGRYFGVGPDTLGEWKKELGTTEKESTQPAVVEKYLRSLGLTVTARQDMTVADLRACWRRGEPVITPVQEYGVPSKEASYKYGHYITVIGVALGHVFVQDPSIDNALGRPGGTQGDAEDPDVLQTPGRSVIAEATFVKAWHDEDVLSNRYESYGIAVGPGKSRGGD